MKPEEREVWAKIKESGIIVKMPVKDAIALYIKGEVTEVCD